MRSPTAGGAALPTSRYVVTAPFRGMRLDRFLQAMIPRMSRQSVQEAIASRVSLASGARPKASRALVEGEIVTIVPRPARDHGHAPPRVLAFGAGWAVLDKPAGLASVPSARRPGEDVVALSGLAPAHRLDRFTSGCLLATSDPAAARHFEAAFRERRVGKTYAAIVVGLMAPGPRLLEGPLARDVSSRIPGRMAVTTGGAPACTEVEAVAWDETLGRTLVRASPRTGRRHQVRVHLADAQHAIVGDLLYGGDERDFVRWQLGQPVDVPEGVEPGRHLLHARALGFEDPDGARVDAIAPWPADFDAELIGRWAD